MQTFICLRNLKSIYHLNILTNDSTTAAPTYKQSYSHIPIILEYNIYRMRSKKK